MAATSIVHQRIASLDFVKGSLVALMVVYHWLNYFIGLQWDGYRYLRFLTPSFIFITGFLVSHVYLSKYKPDDPKLRWRLISRGMKLLVLFVALNVAVDLVLGWPLHLRSMNSTLIAATIEAVFVHGSGRAAFDVLVSIGYFLIVAPVALTLSHRLQIPLLVVAAGAVLSVAMLGRTTSINPHVEMLSFGLLGLAIGIPRTASWLPHPSTLAVLGVYVLYLAGVTLWNATYTMQVFGVCLTLLLIHTAAVTSGADGWWQRALIRLGQYSLFAYIVQIAILQVLRLTLRQFALSNVELLILLGVALAATILAVEGVRFFRSWSLKVDAVYRAVFA